MYCCSVAKLCPVLCHPMDCSMPGFASFPVSQSLLKFMSVESVMLPVSSSAASFFYLQSFSTSVSFPLSYLFVSGGQGIGASASASVLPVNIQGWFLLGWTGLISLQSNRLSRVFNTAVQKHLFFWHSAFFIVQLSHPSMTTGKTLAGKFYCVHFIVSTGKIALVSQTFVGKVMSLLFTMLSKSIITFLPKSKLF